ncbi:hypothetical protein [Streptomyces sp. MOE7]|uniref:hypothetical protein n=1 Tax=Streptomyces sp. MOE7 TaxID=1961713 RepID=UPI003FA6D904
MGRQVERPAQRPEGPEVEGAGHTEQLQDPHLVRRDVLQEPLDDVLGGDRRLQPGRILKVGVDGQVQIERHAGAGFGDRLLPAALGDSRGGQQIEPGGHRQALHRHVPDHRGPVLVVRRPVQWLAAGHHGESALQLAEQVTQPGIGAEALPAGQRSGHQRFVGVHEQHEGLLGARLAEFLGEQVGDRIAEFGVGEVVEILQRGVGLDALFAAPVGQRPVRQADQSRRGTEDRKAHGVVEDLRQDVALLRERRARAVHTELRVHPLPQDRIGDVEPVELHALRTELGT